MNLEGFLKKVKNIYKFYKKIPQIILTNLKKGNNISKIKKKERKKLTEHNILFNKITNNSHFLGKRTTHFFIEVIKQLTWTCKQSERGISKKEKQA